MKNISIILIFYTAVLQAINTTENSTEFDLSCNENDTCLTSTVESNDNTTTDILYSTEIYVNDSMNSTLESTLESNEPQIHHDILSKSNIDFCLCDLQLDYCDINCCCDVTCTHEQKAIFSDCHSPPIFQNPYHCYTSEISYERKTKLFWEVSEHRLFCIVRSNLPPHHIIQLDKSVESLKNVDFNKMQNTWPKFLETEDLEILKPQQLSSMYEHHLYLYMPDGQFVPLMLPEKFTSNICVQKKPVRFLIDFTSSCRQMYVNENNHALNPETYYKNISILSLPKLSNSSLVDTYGLECTRHSCLSINVFLCDETLNQCETLRNDTSIKIFCHSKFRINQSCAFVAQKVKYHFFYNVSSGLTNINLYMFLSNISYYINDNIEFVQYFEVKFYWEGYMQNYSSLLSGNPGYILGKNILYGNLISDNLNNSTLKHTISKNDTDITKNFLVFPRNVKGFCVLNNEIHLPVQFGYNMRSNCIYRHEINISENATLLCKNLQKHIFHIWQMNIGENNLESGKYVGMFGNSDRMNIPEWTEILYKFNNSNLLKQILGEFRTNRLICKNIAQVLSVYIVYAHIDFEYTKYQAKIVNVIFEPQLTKYFNVKYFYNESLRIHLVDVDLKTEITFYDITTSKLNYASPPNLHISLPHDFLSPFMMNSKTIISGNFRLLFCFLYFLIKH